MTDQDRKIIEDWLNDPQVSYLSKLAAEVVTRLMTEGVL